MSDFQKHVLLTNTGAWRYDEPHSDEFPEKKPSNIHSPTLWHYGYFSLKIAQKQGI